MWTQDGPTILYSASKPTRTAASGLPCSCPGLRACVFKQPEQKLSGWKRLFVFPDSVETRKFRLRNPRLVNIPCQTALALKSKHIRDLVTFGICSHYCHQPKLYLSGIFLAFLFLFGGRFWELTLHLCTVLYAWPSSVSYSLVW